MRNQQSIICEGKESTYAGYDGHKLGPRRLICKVSMLTTSLDIILDE